MTGIPSRERQLINGVWQYVTAEEGGGGGSQPLVSCCLDKIGLDVETVDFHLVSWTRLYDNPWDANPLGAIPAGLGLTFAFDGSSPTITVTEAGVWAFTYIVAVADDATWQGAIHDGIVGFDTGLPSLDGGAGSAGSYAVTCPLPAGATGAASVRTTVGATTGGLAATVFLTITRLA